MAKSDPKKTRPAPAANATPSPDPDSQPVQEVAQRRRGRPRKAAAPAAPEASVTSEKRRRGRPPKSGTKAPVGVMLDDINLPEIQNCLRELIRTAKEQDHLTWDDLNEALPQAGVTPDLMDEIVARLHTLEIRIVDAAEVERPRTASVSPSSRPKPDLEGAAKLDLLDDPVRMYLRQMGQVPLLTRDQEIHISKRIEKAEGNLQQCLQDVGFVGETIVGLAEGLASGIGRFDRLVMARRPVFQAPRPPRAPSARGSRPSHQLLSHVAFGTPQEKTSRCRGLLNCQGGLFQNLREILLQTENQ